jgi:hypothetical protein
MLLPPFSTSFFIHIIFFSPHTQNKYLEIFLYYMGNTAMEDAGKTFAKAKKYHFHFSV